MLDDNLRTLRQWAELAPPQSIDTATTALLCIDFQLEYFAGKLPAPHGPQASTNASMLVDWADARSMPVAHIGYEDRSPGAVLFVPGSGMTDFHPAVLPKPHHKVFMKGLPSSFAETGLGEWLRERGIQTVIVTGLQTHSCISSSVRDASHQGFKIIIASDACASRNLPAYDGSGVVPHIAMHRTTLTALADRYADVFTTDEIMGMG